MTATAIESPTVAIDAIVVDEEFNPRKSRDGAKFDELVSSIGQHGILQPLLVEPGADGTYLLRAGGRRLAAARRAGLKEVPVHVRDAGEEASTYAVLENLQREDLNPVDEAAGFKRVLDGGKLTQKDLAAKLSVSPGFVSERLGLLRLPDAVQTWIASGELATAAARPLEKVAKASEALAAHVAYLARGRDTSRLEEQLPGLIDRVAEGATAEVDELPTLSTLVPANWHFGVDALDWADHEELRDRAVALHEATRFELCLDDDDIDAARAFKCVFEFTEKDRWGETHHAWMLDREFILSRIALHVDARETEIADRAKAAVAGAGATDDPAASDDGAAVAIDPREAERQRRAAERATRKEAMTAAASRNEEIGRKLMTKLHAPKITTARMRLLAMMIVDRHSDLAAAGLALCDERLIEKDVRTLKSGEKRTKVTYLESSEATQSLTERIERAKKPEEVLGVILQALVAGAHADPNARTNTQMIRWHVPRGWNEKSPAREIRDLIDRDALAVLPSDEVAAIKESKKKG